MDAVKIFTDALPLSPTKVLIAARVSPDLWARVKAQALRESLTVEVAVGDALHQWVQTHQVPSPLREVTDL